MNMLVATKDLSHDEWLCWRRNGIGGSDAAAVAGISRYKSPMEVYLEKTGEIEPKETTEYAYWGQVLEPIIRKEFVIRTGLKVNQRRAMFKHSDYPFLLANVDGFVTDPERGKGIFEAKTANAFVTKEWQNGGIPDEYVVQVQHYLAVTGLSFAYIAVLIGGNDFRCKLIERDDALIKLLIRAEAKFWQHVKTKTPPRFDGSKASSELLNRLYPAGTQQSKITLPLDALSLIEQFESAQREEKEASIRKDEASNLLKSMLGENETGFICDRIINWKNVNSTRFNSKALKNSHPDIYKQFVEISNYRKFSVK